MTPVWVTGLRAQKKVPKRRQTEPATGMAAGDAEGALGTAGPWAEPYWRCLPLLRRMGTHHTTRIHTTMATLQPSWLCLPDNHIARQIRPLGSESHWRPPCAAVWLLKGSVSYAPPACMCGQVASEHGTPQNQGSNPSSGQAPPFNVRPPVPAVRSSFIGCC